MVGALDERSKADEQAIRVLWDAGDLRAAASEVVRRLGPEILGLLCAMHRDRDVAGDAFSLFTERLWTSLPDFEWKCSMRTWAYMLARRASVDVHRTERRREKRNVALSDVPELARVAGHVRTATLTFLQSEVKTELTRLRDSLPEEDKLLLVLRVDRQLAWTDLAHVFLEEREAASSEAVKREAARLRKRFQLVKDRLKALMLERGLGGDDP